MDQFGVLTESYGLKPQGKSAPMASSKRPINVGNSQTGNFGVNSGLNPKSSQFGSTSPQNSSFDYGSFFDYQNGVFGSGGSKRSLHFGGLDGGFDVFGGNNRPTSQSNVDSGSFNYDSIFMGSDNPASTSSSSQTYVDDIFGGMPGLKNPASAKADNGLSAFTSQPKQSVRMDDLLEKIGGLQAKSKSMNTIGSEGLVNKAPGFDDLIPGFGGSSLFSNIDGLSTPIRRVSAEMSKPHKQTSNKPTVTSHDDPFLVFEKASSTVSSESFLDPLEQISKLNDSGSTRGGSNTSTSLKSPPKPVKVVYSNKVTAVNQSGVSSVDELENFAMGGVQNNASNSSNIHSSEYKQKSATKTKKNKVHPDSAIANQSRAIDDLESFFSMGSRSSSVPKSRATTSDHTFVGKTQDKGKPEAPQRVASGSSASVKKSSVIASFDDLSLIFDEACPSSEFMEVEGETEERRRARLGRHQRTQERAAKAVADMNQRDLQSKMEQEERRKIADTVDVQIKRWSAGKEGNMRALLSSLQYVLWPECGWQPVSLTDMITSASVKKVYRKATLCIHPDKVQQKGANLEQKYTAEKVFDILKEAWNKFNAEELS